MAVSESFQGHVKVWLGVSGWEEDVSVTNDSFEVCLHEFKHKMQVSFVGEGVNQLDYVWVFELFEKFDLSKSSEVDPFLLLPQPNLLYRHRLSSLHSDMTLVTLEE